MARSIDGGAGDDKIISGFGGDTIYFGKINSFNDLLNDHTEFKNGDVILNAGDDRLTVHNLSATDFDSTVVSFRPRPRDIPPRSPELGDRPAS